jgi:predicted transcriptional regulator
MRSSCGSICRGRPRPSFAGSANRRGDFDQVSGQSLLSAIVILLYLDQVLQDNYKELIYKPDASGGENGMPASANPPDLLALTAAIVAAHVSKNTVVVNDLPNLIQQVYGSLAHVGRDAPVAPRPQPAVPIKKSVTPDFIICLEDGRKLKMLKRHLKTAYDMTPEEYRDRWGLAPDYPMVAPNYAIQRSELAKQIGLGTTARKRRGPK